MIETRQEESGARVAHLPRKRVSEGCPAQRMKKKEAGVTDEEIRGAVDIGQTVKERPASIIKETADKLTGTDLSSNSIPEQHPVAGK